MSSAVAPKGYRNGTHRVNAPEETVNQVLGLLPAMGITRVANVTGLDRIGIPVVMVCRPNSRTIAVHQGKGLTLEAAKASGIMEAIESYHGEHITQPLKIANYEDLCYTHPVIDPTALSRLSTSFYHHHLQIPWICGTNLMTNELVWVPYEVVHTNYTIPMPAGSGSFIMSSNGCASGNHILEAIVHGVSEVIERDATSLWQMLDQPAQAETRLDLATVDDPGCIEVLDKYEQADMAVIVWETTSDIGIPSFLCSILDGHTSGLSSNFTSSGAGTHSCREIALFRALTEAAQSRLTLISGARDDNLRGRYQRAQDPDTHQDNLERINMGTPTRDFQEVPTYDGDTFEEDLSWILDRLEKAGYPQVIAVDLTRPEFKIPVVRIVIPGLEGSHKTEGYVPGPRAQAQMKRRQPN